MSDFPVVPVPAPVRTRSGFPPCKNYLRAGIENISSIDAWQIAEPQHHHFVACLNRANGTLLGQQPGGRLPEPVYHSWVWEWADCFLNSTRQEETAHEIAATYKFARFLDDRLGLSEPSPDRPFVRDVEFTYYPRTSTADGVSYSYPFLDDGYEHERIGGGVPIPFPRGPQAPGNIAPRYTFEGFLEWGSFLASGEPLTTAQRDDLGHVGCSIDGVGHWIRDRGTHGEQCGGFVRTIRRRLQEAIRAVSRKHADVLVLTIPDNETLAVALDQVENWLKSPGVKALLSQAETVARTVRDAGSGGGEDSGPLTTPPSNPPAPKVPKDGPFQPFGFRFKGMECHGLTALRMRLLAGLWDEGSGRKFDSRKETVVMEDVYPGEEDADTKFRVLVKDTNDALFRARVVARVTRKGGLIWIQDTTT